MTLSTKIIDYLTEPLGVQMQISPSAPKRTSKIEISTGIWARIQEICPSAAKHFLPHGEKHDFHATLGVNRQKTASATK
jgi:hypothetical protein